jgi:hypothetical protein
LDEAQRALDRGVLVPVHLEKIGAYPLGFGQVHAHDLTAWDGDAEHAAFKPVVAAVRRLAPDEAKVAAPPRRRKRKAAAQSSSVEQRASPQTAETRSTPQPLAAPPAAEANAPFSMYELGFIAAAVVVSAVLAWPLANLFTGFGARLYAYDTALLFNLNTPQNVLTLTPLLVGAAWIYDRLRTWWAGRGRWPSLVQWVALALLVLHFLMSLNTRTNLGREAHIAVGLLLTWGAATYARPAVAWLRPRIERQLAALKQARRQ